MKTDLLKKFAPVIGIFFLAAIAISYTYATPARDAQLTVGGGDSTINTLDQWKSDGTNITQRTASKPIKLTGIATGLCLTLTGGGVITTTTCGSGGGSGTGTISTSSAAVVPNLLYFTSSSQVGNVATGTASATLPLSVTAGRSCVGGACAFSIANAIADGSTLGAASFTANDFDSSSGNISIDYTNGQKASAAVPGFLTVGSFTKFNSATTTAGTGLTYSGNAFNVNTSQNIATLSNLTSNGFVYTAGAAGTLNIAASSSIFGFTPASNATTLTINGTTNQITSSAGAQDLSANRTWTLSLPNPVIFPGNASSTLFSTTYASSTSYYGAGLDGGCNTGNFLQWTAGRFGCAADTVGSGGSDPFTHPAAGQSATTSLVLLYGQASSTILSANYAQFGSTVTTTIANGLIVLGTSTAVNTGDMMNLTLNRAGFSRLVLDNPNTAGGTNVRYMQNGVLLANTAFDNALDQLQIVANAASSSIGFFTAPNGITSVERMRILSSGNVNIATTSRQWEQLAIASSTAPQLSFLSGTNANAFVGRNQEGTFWFGTSTQAGATSTTAAFSIDANNKVTFGNAQATCVGLTGSLALCDGDDATGAGGGTYSFTPATFGAQNVSATTSGIWVQNNGQYSFMGTSSLIDYASSTAITVSGNSYLGTVKTGLWNGTKIGAAFGGTNGTASISDGGIYFGSGGVIAQSASLSPFYDTTDDALNLGAGANPTYKLEVMRGFSNGFFGVTSKATNGNNGDVFSIDKNRNVGISTSSPMAMLAILATSTNGVGSPPYLFAIASTTGGTATSTIFSIDNIGAASTTKLFGAQLSTCDPTTGKLTWSNGNFGCGTDVNTGGGGGSGFTFGTLTFSTSTAATSTSIWLNGGSLFSSSTVASQIPYASSTMHSMTTASTTNLTVDTVTSALALGGATGVIGEYGGSAPCTNQVALSLSATGVITCTSVTNAMLTNSGAINFTYVGNVSGSASGAPGGTVTVTVPWEYSSKSSFGTTTISTTTSITTQGAFFSSSTQASQFPYASTTMLSATTASTTNLTVDTITSALALGGATGVMGEYAGSSGVCTNQFPTSISAVGALGTCTSVTDSFFSGQLGLSHGGTNASLSGANQITFMNAGNTALATNASSIFGWQDAANWLVIGTSTSAKALVTLGTSTAPQLTLTDDGNTDAITFRDAGNSFFISTSSPTTYATSTNPILSVANFISTFFTQFLVKITSATAFAIQDGFGTAVVNVNTASTTGSIFSVAATTSPNLGSGAIKLFDVDQYGHLTASSTKATPTLSCTPTNNGTIGANSNDVTGDITTGTLSTSCTVTFGSVYSATPEIMLTGSSATIGAAVSSRSTTAFTITLGSAITGDDVSYFVVMP